MAKIIHFSCFLTRPCSLPSPLFGRTQFPGNFGQPFEDVNGAVETHHLLRERGKQSLLCCQMPEGKRLLERISSHYDELNALELMMLGQGGFWLRVPVTAFLAANILIITAPMKALAETCEADNSFFNMPLLLFVALIGATVGGLLARQRKGELQRVNEQLRQINAALRRQAKIESYAPSLSYAPIGGRISEKEVIVDPRKEELISRLKSGKNFLRNQELEKAFLEFKTALELATSLKDPIEEKKAARGLGASLQRQGKYQEAIKYHSMVLAISDREGEDSGNTEAYGAIADCYTELGDLEKAGIFYDKYIARLETD
ncbi:fluorescent in blue light, chloroplastic -like protein [Gossypium arboreum]|uniref:Fluorescent in blue light, chloroplastic-like protein n=1 Tax=Gossypium arboreum TaxID=29729 RepID=A0A0B0PI92_GOSAR|nr:protein FLUORESCENT IN BLUE LIGHT, chloroplastic-like isoform X2 [Gossypium arboreum]KHG18203.1 fluorescent in blue light, chloroplastic -like protein [Gossypium arboreum]KHG24627.1 fluorescent in blue light, chloroplastic -like protein [Gossypium arboreum]